MSTAFTPNNYLRGASPVDISALEAQITALQGEITAALNELEALENAYNLDIAAIQADLTQAQADLSAAQATLDAIPGQIAAAMDDVEASVTMTAQEMADLAEAAAIAAAAADATTKANTAKSEAIADAVAAAELEAQALADAARDDAIFQAGQLADLAEAAAIATASADAQAKADLAEAAAISAAEAEAEAARLAAIAAADADSTAKADAAEAAAILAAEALAAAAQAAAEATAAADATTKVNAAKVEAINDAVAQAVTLANQAEADAIAAAALTAQEKADLAEAAAIANAQSYVDGEIDALVITADKIAAGAVIAGKIAADAVLAANIKAGEINTDHLVAGAVTAAKIAANTITANEIAAAAITADELAANSVTAVKILANAVEAGKIAAGAVVAGNIAANAVISESIAANAITADHLDADSVTADAIAAGAIEAIHVSADAITTDAIAAGAITATEIATDAVTADKILAGSVVAGKLAADAVLANNIKAGEIGADHIAANSINTVHLIANAVTAAQIATGAVTTDKLLANSVTTEKITSGAITTEKISLGVLKTNLVPDPSFEEDHPLTNWDPNGTWFGQGATQGDVLNWRVSQLTGFAEVHKNTDPTYSRSGNGSLLLVNTDALTDQASAVSAAIPVVIGKTYRVQTYLKVTDMAYFSILVRSSDSQSFTATDNIMVVTTDGDYTTVNPSEAVDGWNEISGVFTATHDWVMIQLVNNGTNVLSNMYVDDVSVIELSAGGGSELTSAGLRIFDGNGYEVGAFVSNRPSYFTVTEGGNALMSISAKGNVTLQDLSVGGTITIAGDTLLGNLAEYTPAIGEGALINGHLDKIPRGLVAIGYLNTGVTWANTEEVYRLSFIAEPGRSYRVTVPSFLCLIGQVNRSTGIYFGHQTPTTPGGTTLGPMRTLGYSYAITTNTTYFQTIPGMTYVMRCHQVGTSVGGDLNAGRNEVYIFTSATATATLQVYNISNTSIPVTVEDIGLDFPSTGVYRYTGSGGTGGGANKQTYTTIWAANNSRTYNGTNNGTTSPQPTDIAHGPWPGGGGDNRYGIITFGNSISSTSGDQVGRSISTAMTGATVKKVEAYLYFNHWYYSGGGTAYIRPGTHTSLPATGTQKTNALKTVANWPKPGGKWVDITSQAKTLSSGNGIRSLVVGNTGTSSFTTYGRINGAAQSYKPQLRITYEK